MSNIAVQNIDLGSVIFQNAEFGVDKALTFTGAATVKEGTILALDSVSKKWVPFVKGGVVNENGIPKAVITYEVVATGAGDIVVIPMIGGTVVIERLVIAADGDATNVDQDVRDQLRVYSILSVSVEELNILDNQ